MLHTDNELMVMIADLLDQLPAEHHAQTREVLRAMEEDRDELLKEQDDLFELLQHFTVGTVIDDGDGTVDLRVSVDRFHRLCFLVDGYFAEGEEDENHRSNEP